LSCLEKKKIELDFVPKKKNLSFTVRPKKLLRRKRLSATDIKHVPRRIINERSALFGN
jgi:hypothetical protein